METIIIVFQSPRGDFGVLKRGAWLSAGGRGLGFNPLAGILVF